MLRHHFTIRSRDIVHPTDPGAIEGIVRSIQPGLRERQVRDLVDDILVGRVLLVRSGEDRRCDTASAVRLADVSSSPSSSRDA